MSAHFFQRVHERIGRVNSRVLLKDIFRAIKEGRTDYVRFYGRCDRDGARLFEFRVRDGRTFFAMLNLDTGTAITVLTPEQANRALYERRVVEEAADA
jgi:hypothetical protein